MADPFCIYQHHNGQQFIDLGSRHLFAFVQEFSEFESNPILIGIIVIWKGTWLWRGGESGGRYHPVW